jgi:hypothetical protein
MKIDEIQRAKDASDIRSSPEIIAYNRLMRFRTRELLAEAKTLPADEYSINSAEREFPDSAAAVNYFEGLKARFKDIGQWNANSHVSSYALYDQNGKPASTPFIERDQFMEIRLHGTGKSDWVRIENILSSPNELVITVKPTYDPTEEPPQIGKTSHFFTARARNNFCAFRENDHVMLYVIGLHETLNSGHTSGIAETARNAALANLGYYLGIQKAVWSSFCDSFLSENDFKQ